MAPRAPARASGAVASSRLARERRARDLQAQRPRVEPRVARARPPAALAKPGSASWRCGDVDAHRQPGALRGARATRRAARTRSRAPGGRAGRSARSPRRSATKSAGSTGSRRRRGQRHSASKPTIAARGGLHDRLVDDLSAARSIAPAQLALHVQPAHHLLVHARRRTRRGGPCRRPWRGTSRRRRRASRRSGAASGVGERDADRRVDEQLAAVELERRAQRVLDALGDHRRLARRRRRRRAGR